VSHDFKTPLTRLKLELAMMGDSVDTTAPRGDVAEMEHMLDEYLDFARGEGGEESQSADLSEILRDAAAAAARARGAGADRLMVQTEPGIVMSVRKNALRRCMTNLIDNALKHGTHVDVALRRNGRNVEVLIDDDGPGIPPDQREAAFRPFASGTAGGTGLGLTISRDIVRAHGGEIELAESPLGGLRARVRLPT